MGHFDSKCPNKLEKKDQATQERQGNEKHHMSKEEKTQFKRKCYLYRERRHMAYSCPFGNNSKSISIDANIMLRKDVLSVETHRRAATGNTKSREVAGALAGTAPSSTARNSVTRSEIPENVGRAT